MVLNRGCKDTKKWGKRRNKTATSTGYKTGKPATIKQGLDRAHLNFHDCFSNLFSGARAQVGF
jgi:hypothetical protein